MEVDRTCIVLGRGWPCQDDQQCELVCVLGGGSLGNKVLVYLETEINHMDNESCPHNEAPIKTEH